MYCAYHCVLLKTDMLDMPMCEVKFYILSKNTFLPPASAEVVIFSVESVCVCVSVCALQAEPLDLRT